MSRIPYALLFALSLGGCTGTNTVGDELGLQGQPPKQDGTCAQGLTNCNNVCTSLTSDSNNCGACGSVCANGSQCTNGVCANANACNPKQCVLANAVAACAMNACAIGSCNAGFADCDKSAKDGCEIATDSDVNNCGACGMVCANGDTCTNGACVSPCDPVKCALPNAVPACANSGCVVKSCDPGFADCNGNAKDGCEVNVGSDPLNCGACANACAQGDTCVAGVCVAGCDPMKCVVPNAVPACANSGCVVKSCDPGYGDCNGNAKDGCEIDLGSDPLNCGACGNACGNADVCTNGACVANNLCGGMVCKLPNAVPGCAMNACTVASCTKGYADCNGKAVDGCESYLFTDPLNCGACGAACPQNDTCVGGVCMANNLCGGMVCKLANAVAGCANNACTIASCSPNYADCNQKASDGCEINLASDPNNCGACGSACGNAKKCVNGACV